MMSPDETGERARHAQRKGGMPFSKILLIFAYVLQDANVATGELPQARQMSEGTTKIAHTQEFNIKS